MDFAKRARYAIEYAGFLALATMLRALPVETASAVSGALWRWFAPFTSRQKRALANLAIGFPEASPAERQRLARAMWENLGRTYAEVFHLDRIVSDGRITLEPPEQFAAIAHGPPFVVCGLHMGNWEIMSQASLRFGLSSTGVYQRLSNPYVDAALVKIRAPHYRGGLLPKSIATARTLLRRARDGGYPAFLADLREDRGVPAPFFGRPALSNPFPAMLARSVGLPLIACAVFRRPGVRFVIHVRPVEVPQSDDRQADILAATANLQAAFEAFIREAPGQWMWGHRRWD